MPEAIKDIGNLDKPIQRDIGKYLHEYVANLQNPRSLGHALKGNFSGTWAYRFRKDYRIICEIQDKEITILVVEVGHRSDIYR